jgi:hypothetical protein
LVAGVLLSLVAYLLGISIGSGWWLILPASIAVASLTMTFYGLWSWDAHLNACRRKAK